MNPKLCTPNISPWSPPQMSCAKGRVAVQPRPPGAPREPGPLRTRAHTSASERRAASGEQRGLYLVAGHQRVLAEAKHVLDEVHVLRRGAGPCQCPSRAAKVESGRAARGGRQRAHKQLSHKRASRPKHQAAAPCGRCRSSGCQTTRPRRRACSGQT